MIYTLNKGIGYVAAAICLLSLALVWAKPASAGFYLSDDAITIDNQIEDAWDDYLVVNDGEDSAGRTMFCWDATAQTWNEVTDETDCTSMLYDPEGQLDIRKAWFGVNETNMLLAFTTVTPMFSLRNMETGEDVSLVDEDIGATGISALPETFDHDMVFAFDTNPANGNQTSFDWYLVANIQYDLSGEIEQEDSFLQIYQESSATDGFQADEDTFVTDVDTSESEAADTTGSEASATLEVRQNIELFYETTGMSSGDEVKFRLETHSNSGDTTKAVRVVFTDSNEITEDALVLGSGATKFNGRSPARYPQGIVSAYAQDDQTLLLEFTAYQRKVGVQVAVGDVDNDDELEIVTVPFKHMPHPELKVFDLQGNLEVAAVIPKGDGIHRLQTYTVAVGDVDDSAGDEIVLANAQGQRVLLDVLQVDDAGFARLAHYDEQLEGYNNGVWVDVADVIQLDDGDSDTGEEIVTGPIHGSAVVDLWSYPASDNAATVAHIVQYDELTTTGFSAGVHIAAAPDQVAIVKHGGNAKVQLHDWVVAKGNLDPTDDEPFTVGVTGNIAFDGTNIAVSSFTRNKVTVYDTAGVQQYQLEVDNKGGFVEFVNL